MAMAAHPSGRRWAKSNGVNLPPLKVAREFLQANQASKATSKQGSQGGKVADKE